MTMTLNLTAFTAIAVVVLLFAPVATQAGHMLEVSRNTLRFQASPCIMLCLALPPRITVLMVHVEFFLLHELLYPGTCMHVCVAIL